MSIYIVTAVIDGERKGLRRGRLVNIENATVFIQSPGAARKAMEKAMKLEHAYNLTDWKVEKWGKGARA